MNGKTETLIGLQERRLKLLIRESVRESISAEIMKLRAAFLPFVSVKEQKEIERLYKKPCRAVSKTYVVEV